MSAEWVTVPDGKRQHLGIQSDHNWQPICGQRSDSYWLPVRVPKLNLRAKGGDCSNCMRVVDALYFLAVDR